MKTKLNLIVSTLLLSIFFAQAQKADVWDFGAVQLDTNLYNNQLDAVAINAWYQQTVVLGSASNNLPTSFTSGVLSWSGISSDRLRTTNTVLTRFDSNIAGQTAFTGRVYCNGTSSVTSGLATNRYMSITLAADDEVTVIARCDAGTGALTFAYATDTAVQKDVAAITSAANTITEVKFVAKNSGVYRIYDASQKASFYRILRKSAVYIPLNGNLDVTQAAGIPAGYSVVFKNTARKSWNAPVVSGTYNVNLPTGYTYQMSLVNANGYILSNGESLTVSETTTNYNIAVKKIDLFTVSGTIAGLGTDISKLTLVYIPDPSANKIFAPVPVINTANSTYTVELETDAQYTISAQGVNNYQIPANTITITGTTSANITFTSKPVYPITINTTGLNASQINSLTLTFTNLNESGYFYTFNTNSAVVLRNGTYAISYSGLDGNNVVMTLTSNLKVSDAASAKTLDFVPPPPTTSLPYTSLLTVGTDKTYQTINAALSAITRMTRSSAERVTVMLDPGNYEEMVEITQANVTLKNAATTPSINLLNKGVDIDAGAVRITSYYGNGYNYFSMKSNQKWNADVLRVNTENGYQLYENQSGTTNNSYWNATLIVSANGFEAENIIIENSFNQYISVKEVNDVLVEVPGLTKGLRPKTIGSTAVQNRSFVERAAAIAIKNNIDKVILNKCRLVGRQDSFFGGSGARVVVFKGTAMGAVDYIFGGMTAVFYQTTLAMNTSDVSGDAAYITAAQQATGRGYLMYECKVTTALPLVETASTFRAKPGYYGRPWQATTSEVVFHNTTVETSDYPGFIGQSLIMPAGWTDSLGGQSAKMYEYKTVEHSGVDNSLSRASWATKVSSPTLTDGTAITTFNFTKGSDNWDPIPALMANDLALKTHKFSEVTSVNVTGYRNSIVISNVKSKTKVLVYSIHGTLVKSFDTNADTSFNINSGFWVVVLKAADGQKAVKLMTY
jgi:pectin methylesterase-like acyl-CoA thioesterase